MTTLCYVWQMNFKPDDDNLKKLTGEQLNLEKLLLKKEPLNTTSRE
jgi:hypothetical protein